MNADRTPKTSTVWPMLRSKSFRKKCTWMGIFKPAEPYSPCDACFI